MLQLRGKEVRGSGGGDGDAKGKTLAMAVAAVDTIAWRLELICLQITADVCQKIRAYHSEVALT